MTETGHLQESFAVKFIDKLHHRRYDYTGAFVENRDRGFLAGVIENNIDEGLNGFIASVCRQFLEAAQADGGNLKDIYMRIASATEFKLYRRRSSLETILTLVDLKESRGGIMIKSPDDDFSIIFRDLRSFDRNDRDIVDCWDLLDKPFVKFVSDFCCLYLEAFNQATG